MAHRPRRPSGTSSHTTPGTFGTGAPAVWVIVAFWLPPLFVGGAPPPPVVVVVVVVVTGGPTVPGPVKLPPPEVPGVGVVPPVPVVPVCGAVNAIVPTTRFRVSLYVLPGTSEWLGSNR